VYSGGPKLSPGASIPLSRTAVPVEWDDFRRQLEKLTEALQPTSPGGVNSVGEFVDSAADNLRGQGDTARDTVLKLSQTISALGDHADDIFSTVRNLQLLVSALSSSSDLLASFNQNLASVTTLLSHSPNDVANTVKGLDQALADVRDFLSDNREAMGVTVDRLSSITTALNDSRADIKQVLHVTPTVFQNFLNIYQPAQSAMTGIIALNNFADIPQWICSSIEAASRARLARVSKLCMQYLIPIFKNRIYNYIPAGINPFVGTQARPNEITYSEDWLRPGAAPPQGTPPPGAPPADAPPAPPLDAPPPPAETPPPNTLMNSTQVLQNLMLPTGQS
jgi:phospholipid/cholesterol/gamma-HCH transport system substrate-binding protein